MIKRVSLWQRVAAVSLLGCSVLLLPGISSAQAIPGQPVAMPESGNPAVALRSGIDKLLAFLRGGQNLSQQQVSAFLDSEIAPFFDFEYMTKTAGGRMFEQMTSEQQQGLVEDVKRNFLSKMAEKLVGYDQQQVNFLPPRAGSDGRTAEVGIAILNPGSYPARLDFRLYNNGRDWLVYDVAANGQSAIVHYRNQLMREMQRRQMEHIRQTVPRPMPPRMPYYGPMR